MKASNILVIIITLLTTIPSAVAKDTGDLQITCKPGIRIYLDNSLSGVTKQAEDGLYIQNIKPGKHVIRAEKEDFLPQVFAVKIEAGRTVEIKIGEFPTKPKMRQEGKSGEGEIKAKVGKVIITSIPLRCQILFLGDNIDKEKDQLIIESVPIGKYPIAFRRDNDVLREEINIESGVTLGVQGDFRQGKVIIEKIETTIGTTEAKTLGAKDSKMCKDGAPMVLIPAGEFTMGTHYGNRDEKPVHKVYLDAFYMDKYEVTNEQYKKFIDSTKHRTPYYWKDLRYNEAHQPVVGVSWYDAVSYCEWAGKRLPTEAEWEKAARGGIDGKKYVWGDAWPPPNNSGNFVKFRGYKDVYTYSSPVGSFNPNGYGLYDMAGNVWELCSDWYSSHYYGDSSSRNPKGPDSGFVRVMRDRGWDDSSNSGVLRVSSRGHLDPAQNAYIDVGFRCAMDAMDVPK